MLLKKLKQVLSLVALGLAAVGCGGQELEPWEEGADAVAAPGERQDALTNTYSVQQECTGTSQVCSPRWTVCQTASTSGTAYATFTVPVGACSSVYVRFYVNGVYKTQSALLGSGMSSGRLSLGTVGAGCHEFALEAVGAVGGCNTGILYSWGGSLKLETP